MADGFIQLPADSTGKKLRTIDRGATGHDQYVIVAAQERQGTYRVGTDHVGGTAAANLVSLENPSASTKRVEITRLVVAISSLAATTAIAYITLGRTTALPSAGTTQTIQKDRTADAAASAVVRSGPTATLATGFMRRCPTPMFLGTAAALPTVDLELVSAGSDNPIVLAAGEAVLVTTSGANDADLRIGVNWSWAEI